MHICFCENDQLTRRQTNSAEFRSGRIGRETVPGTRCHGVLIRVNVREKGGRGGNKIELMVVTSCGSSSYLVR